MNLEAAHLVEGLRAARVAMRQVLVGIDPDREIYPGWHVRHLLAHLSGWDEVAITAIDALGRGESYAIARYQGLDDFNRRSVEARRESSAAAIAEEWERLRQTLEQRLVTLPPELLERPMVLPWGGPGSVASLVTILIDHEVEHSEEIHRLWAGV